MITLIAHYYKFKHRLVRLLRGFKLRPEWVVLDVGSGDSPFPPADVLCEKFPFDDRERDGAFAYDRPVVIGDIEALPFKDKSFDFIYCSHVLEHTEHPDLAIKELMRVGRRGYIEVPSAYNEKTVVSKAGHYWYVDFANGELIFTAKPRGILDESLNQLTQSKLMDKNLLYSAFIYGTADSLLSIGIYWDETIRFRINKPEDFDPKHFDKGHDVADGIDLKQDEQKRDAKITFAGQVKR